MSPNDGLVGVNQFQPFDFPVRRSLANVRREPPTASADWMPVPFEYPEFGLAVVAAFSPTPETVPDNQIHFAERTSGHDVPVIVHPAENNSVEFPQQALLTRRFVLAKDRSDFLQERVRVPLRRPDQQLAAVFTEILSKEVEPLVDMRDARLVRRES